MRRRRYWKFINPWMLWWQKILKSSKPPYYRWTYHPMSFWELKMNIPTMRYRLQDKKKSQDKTENRQLMPLANIQINKHNLSNNNIIKENSSKAGFFGRILRQRAANKRFYQILEQRILDIAHKYGNIVSGPRVLVEVREIDGRIVTAEDIETVIKRLVKRKYLYEIDRQLYIVPGLDLTVKELELIKLFYRRGGVLAPTDAMIELPDVFKTVDDVLEIIKKLQKKGVIINGSYEKGMQFQLPAAELNNKNEFEK